MLTLGFVREIIDDVTRPELKDKLLNDVEYRL
jgi:hypothetical protein